MTKELVTNGGKIFNRRNFKNMSLISEVIYPSEVLDMDEISSRRIPIDDYPIFTKVDPLEIMQAYIVDCLASGYKLVDLSYDELPNAPNELSLRKKRKASKMLVMNLLDMLSL